jgi:hypothetical protein
VALVNVPLLTLYPFMATVPWFVVNQAGQPVYDPQGRLVPLIGVVGGQPRPLPAGSLVTLNGLNLIKQGYGLPPGIPGANGQPLPDAVVLDNAPGGELSQANAYVQQMNDFIASEAAARGYALVDVNALIELAAAEGRLVAGVHYTTEFVTGGFFSLDGIHPGAMGQGFAANALIDAVNDHYGAEIPLVNLNEFLGVPINTGDGFEPTAGPISTGDIEAAVFEHVLRFFAPAHY